MPVVGLPWLVVPQTTMPRSWQAFMSIEALWAPVVISSLSFGRPSITGRRKRVRSRIMTTISKSLHVADGVGIGAPHRLVEHLISTSLVIFDQSASLSATFW